VLSRNSSSDDKDSDEKKDDDAKGQMADAGKADSDAKNGKSNSSTSRQRYIMVMAQFNEDLIPKPTLEPVPESKPATDRPADSKGEEKSDAKAGAKGEAAKNAKADSKNAAKSAADAKKDAAAEKKSDEANADNQKPSDKTTEEDPDVKEAERERIEKQNRVKQDEYNDKVKAGQDRVKELNARFADWYYVVSDETYHKIHLGEDQIIKKKAPEKAADATLPANPFPPAKSAPAAPKGAAPAPAKK
jgi:hypothetical protein